LSKVAGEDVQGSVQGFASSVGSLASVFGLVLGGFLYGLLGGYTFLASAAIIYLIALLALRLPMIQKAQMATPRSRQSG
jgi:MFS family permease